MAKDIETREFNWRECPFCDSNFDRQCEICSVVKADELGIQAVSVKCLSCGTVYNVERIISWRARKVASGKPSSQEVAEFLADRERRLVEAHKRCSDI